MRERTAAAAGQAVQAAARHRDGLAGRQQHLRAVAAEGDDGDLVAAGVALLQQRQRRALRVNSRGACQCMSALCGSARKEHPKHSVPFCFVPKHPPKLAISGASNPGEEM